MTETVLLQYLSIKTHFFDVALKIKSQIVNHNLFETMNSSKWNQTPKNFVNHLRFYSNLVGKLHCWATQKMLQFFSWTLERRCFEVPKKNAINFNDKNGFVLSTALTTFAEVKNFSDFFGWLKAPTHQISAESERFNKIL